MKTIKELEDDEEIPFIWANGYNKCRKDVVKLIDEVFYYKTRDGRIPIISIDKLEELKSRIEG